jgi:transglutaminase-like putative cysteine protease
MKFAMATLVAAASLSSSLPAVSAEALDLQTRFGRYYTNVVVNEDGTAVESSEWSMTVLKESAIERAKRASVGFSTSAQKADVVAAYTLKADGRRLEVPKDNYQVEVNKGNGKDSPVYSDRTTLTVVFPDVSVGDSVVFSYRIAQTEPMFPKHYSTAQIFYNQVAHDDVRVRIDWPASMWVQYEARGMNEFESTTNGDRRAVEWRYSNPAPKRTERKDFSVFDPEKEAGYAFSTFKTYADVTSAYGVKAIPKAVPDERIKTLAATIVGDKTAKKEQAHALYDWVATNITYAGNCIGIGGVVPRDLAFVLDNKMGDCKDHATLLQALLAARGIASTQALVNSGSIYRLPRIPVVSMVNHVINHLPEFDLYVDSTSNDTPFGMLPRGDQDKPVLLVEGYRDGTRTPASPLGSNREKMKAALRVDADGAITGTVEVTQQGHGAISTRTWAREMTKDVESDLIKDMIRNQGLIGSGKFEKDDPTGLKDSYHYKVSLNAEKYLRMPGAGAFYVAPPFGIGSVMGGMMNSAGHPEPDVDVACSSAHAVEDYTIELPKKMKVLSIPQNMKIANDILSYTATYKLTGNILTVHRTLDDRTKGNVCSPKTMAEFKKIADKAMDNLKEQVLYK